MNDRGEGFDYGSCFGTGWRGSSIGREGRSGPEICIGEDACSVSSLFPLPSDVGPHRRAGRERRPPVLIDLVRVSFDLLDDGVVLVRTRQVEVRNPLHALANLRRQDGLPRNLFLIPDNLLHNYRETRKRLDPEPGVPLSGVLIQVLQNGTSLRPLGDLRDGFWHVGFEFLVGSARGARTGPCVGGEPLFESGWGGWGV